MIKKDGKFFCEKCGTVIPEGKIEHCPWDDGDGYIDMELKATCPRCGQRNGMWE